MYYLEKRESFKTHWWNTINSSFFELITLVKDRNSFLTYIAGNNALLHDVSMFIVYGSKEDRNLDSIFFLDSGLEEQLDMGKFVLGDRQSVSNFSSSILHPGLSLLLNNSSVFKKIGPTFDKVFVFDSSGQLILDIEQDLTRVLDETGFNFVSLDLESALEKSA